MPRLKNAILNSTSLHDVLSLLQNLFLYEDYFEAFDLRAWTINPSLLPPYLQSTLSPAVASTTPLPSPANLETALPCEIVWQLARSVIGSYYTNSICQPPEKLKWRRVGFKQNAAEITPYMSPAPVGATPPAVQRTASAAAAPLFYDHKGPLCNHFSLSIRRSRYRKLTTSSSTGNSSMRRTMPRMAATAAISSDTQNSPPDFLSLPEVLVHSIVTLSQMRNVAEESRKIVSSTTHMIRTFPSLSPDLTLALVESYALLISYSAPFIGVFKDHISAAVLNHMKIPSFWIHKVHQLAYRDQARVLAHSLKVLIVLDLIRATTKSGRNHPSALLIRTKRALGGGGVNNTASATLTSIPPTSPPTADPSETQTSGQQIRHQQDNGGTANFINSSTSTLSAVGATALSGDNQSFFSITRSWEFIVRSLCQDLRVVQELPQWIPSLIEVPINNILRVCKSPRKLVNFTALDTEFCIKNIFRSNVGYLKKIPSSSNDESGGGGGGGGGSPPPRVQASACARLKRLKYQLAILYILRKNFALRDHSAASGSPNTFNPITLLFLTCEKDITILQTALDLSLKREGWEVCQDLESLVITVTPSWGGVSSPADETGDRRLLTNVLRFVSQSYPDCYARSSVLRKARLSAEHDDELLLANEQKADERLVGENTLCILASMCYDHLTEPSSAGQIFKSLPHIRPILQTKFTFTKEEDDDDEEERNRGASDHRQPTASSNAEENLMRLCQCKHPHLQVRSKRRKEPGQLFLSERGRNGWSLIHGLLLRQNLCARLLPEEASSECAAALIAEYIRDIRYSKRISQPSITQLLWLLRKADLWITMNRSLLFEVWGWHPVYFQEDNKADITLAHSSDATMIWNGSYLQASSTAPGAIISDSVSQDFITDRAGAAGLPNQSADDEFSNWDNSIPEDSPPDMTQRNCANILRYASYTLIIELQQLVEEIQRANYKSEFLDNLFQSISQNVLTLFSGHTPHDSIDTKTLYTLEPLRNAPHDQLHEATCQQTLFQAALYSLYLKLVSKHKKASYATLHKSAIDMEIIGCRIMVIHQIRRLCLTRYNALHPVRSSLTALVLSGPSGAGVSPDARRNMLFNRCDQMQEAIMKIVSVIKQACSDDSKVVLRKLRRDMLQAACLSFHEELKDKGALAQLLLIKGEPLICSRSRRILTRLQRALAPGQSPSISDALSSVLIWHDRKIPFHHYHTSDHHHHSSAQTNGLMEITMLDCQQITLGLLARKYISTNMLSTANLELDRRMTIYANHERITSAGLGWFDRLVRGLSLDPTAPPLPLKYALMNPDDLSEHALARSVGMAQSTSELAAHIPQLMHRAIRKRAFLAVWFEILRRGSDDQAFLSMLHRSIVSEINISVQVAHCKLQRGRCEVSSEVSQLLRLSQFGVLMLSVCTGIDEVLKSSRFVEQLVLISGAASKVEAKDREKFVRDGILGVCKNADLTTHGRVDGESGAELEYGSSHQPATTELKQIVSIETMLRSKIIAECQAKSSPMSSMARPTPAAKEQSFSLAQYSTLPEDRRRGSFSPGNVASTYNSILSSQGVDQGNNGIPNQLAVEGGIVSPVNGQKIISVDIESVRILKSAAKVPYMIKFEKAPGSRNNAHSLIFKCNDDIRQDMLVHQVSCLMNSIFVKAGLPLRIITYKAVPVILRDQMTNGGSRSCIYGGIIEMLENCKSRHEIGDTYGLTLDGYYSRSYSSQSLEPARWNFTTSLAAASLLTFILQIKDRHNANILLTHDGFLVHIDFGFILDLAPAHDLKFERAPFKLTNEMIGLIDGGSQDSSGTLILRQLITHGYLALRVHRQELVGLIESYQNSNVKGFKAASIANLKTRLQYDKSDHDATEYILRQTRAAVNALTTKLYDVFQSVQQGIAF